MPEIGIPELIIILVLVLLFFGPRRLPEIGAALGQAMRKFRQGMGGEEGPPPPDPLQDTHTKL